MDLDRQSDLAALDTTLTTVERVLDTDGLRAKIQKLEQDASDPNLWDDQANAQRVTSELSHAQSELRRVEGLRSRLDDLPVLYEMAAEEQGAGAEDALAEADAELKSLQADIEVLEVRTLLSGEYDEREALVTIRSGAGGVDAADKGMRIGLDGVQLLGGHGYTKEHPVERWYRDLRAVGVAEGVVVL